MSFTAWRALVAGVGLMITGVLPAFLTASLASRIPADFAFGDSRLGLAAIATAISCLAIAAFAQSSLSLTALLLLGGLANALGGRSVSLLLKREVAVHRHGLAFGAQNSGATLGALFAGLAVPAVAIPFGWRWAFVLVAGLALAAAAVAAALASAAGVGFVPSSSSTRSRAA
jgi:MFS family permease